MRSSLPSGPIASSTRAPLPVVTGACHRLRRRRVRDDSDVGAGEGVELVLDQRTELPMDSDDWKTRVARLLQPFDEQRAIPGGSRRCVSK